MLINIAEDIADNDERNITTTCYRTLNVFYSLGFDKNGSHYFYRHKMPKRKMPKLFMSIEEYSLYAKKMLEKEQQGFKKNFRIIERI